MVYGSIVELDAHVFAPEFNLAGREVHAVISDDAVGDTVSVYDSGYKVDNLSGYSRFHWCGFYPFGELIYHDQ